MTHHRLFYRRDLEPFELLFVSRSSGPNDAQLATLGGMQTIRLISQSAFYKLPLNVKIIPFGGITKDKIVNTFTPLKNLSRLIINIENIGDDALKDTAYRVKVANEYAQVLKWVKEVVPLVKIGIYSTAPRREYIDALRAATHPEFQAWVADNTILKVVADQADVLYPSLYTFKNTSIASWKIYAARNIEETRRISGYAKPIYPFLWNLIHGTTNELPVDYMMEQLSYLFRHPDVSGVVYWIASSQIWSDTGSIPKSIQNFMAKRQIDLRLTNGV